MCKTTFPRDLFKSKKSLSCGDCNRQGKRIESSSAVEAVLLRSGGTLHMEELLACCVHFPYLCLTEGKTVLA